MMVCVLLVVAAVEVMVIAAIAMLWHTPDPHHVLILDLLQQLSENDAQESLRSHKAVSGKR